MKRSRRSWTETTAACPCDSHEIVPLGSRHLASRADHLDIRPSPQVIIDDLAAEGKARDSKWNRRKCNPNRECRRKSRSITAADDSRSRLAATSVRENNAHGLAAATLGDGTEMTRLRFDRRNVLDRLTQLRPPHRANGNGDAAANGRVHAGSDREADK